jgi:single-stranded DNA-specific DHH superfamily exonuclease
MAWILGLGGNKLENVVKRTDNDIKKLFQELIEPKIVLLHPINIEKAKNLINEILNKINQNEHLLKSHHYNLHSFPEIYQLKDSIDKILKIFEEVDKNRNNPNQKINYNLPANDIKKELLKIRESWNIYKYKLHELGILKEKE